MKLKVSVGLIFIGLGFSLANSNEKYVKQRKESEFLFIWRLRWCFSTNGTVTVTEKQLMVDF